MEKILEQLKGEVEKLFGDDASGHDIYHLNRVLNNALAIQEKEGGDRLIIAASAFLHDVHRLMQQENGEYCSPKDSLPKVREMLDKTDLTEEQKKKVLHCVEYHEEYNFSEKDNKATDIETLILQDADDLDAVGAIGIGRAFVFGGLIGEMMWDPDKPLKSDTYEASKKEFSIMHHFHSKVLKLKDHMNTETAKKMAEKRHEFTEQFIQEFFDEWDGKK